jgi:4-hydroxybenzoate polyprenyltransferase
MFLAISLCITKIDYIIFIVGFVISLSLTPTFLLLNDYTHRKEDVKMGRKRLLSSSINPNQILIIFFLLIFVISLLLLIRSPLSLLAFFFLFMTTLSYGYAKHKRNATISYVNRYLSGLFTFLLYGFFIQPIFTEKHLILGLFVAGFDLAVNITGDIRDLDKDIKTKLKTIPVLIGKTNTLYVIGGIISSQYIFFSILFPSAFYYYPILMIWMGGGFVMYYLTKPTTWAHAYFHLPKVQQFIWIANGLLYPNNLLIGLIISIGIGIIWLFAYFIYLYSDNEITLFWLIKKKLNLLVRKRKKLFLND